MTDPISREEIYSIVQKIVSKTMEGALPPANTAQTASSPAAAPAPKITGKRVVAIGTDHGGVDLKDILKKELTKNGFEVIDCGTHTKDSVDYPDIALSVSELVAAGKAWRGVIIDGAGIGSCMAANKVPGVRAAMCYDYATAVNSREHNNANVLTLGAGLIGVNLAKQILNTWLATEFGAGRHARRVNKITAIMDRFIKDGTSS